MIVDDECVETVNASTIVKKRKQGACDTRPDTLVMFNMSGSKTICTGFGAGHFDLYMTAETRLRIKAVTGHGRVIVAPHSTLDSMMSGYISK